MRPSKPNDLTPSYIIDVCPSYLVLKIVFNVNNVTSWVGTWYLNLYSFSTITYDIIFKWHTLWGQILVVGEFSYVLRGLIWG